MYDPFAPGPHPVWSRTVEARDVRRGQSFPCEVWRPTDVDDADGTGDIRALPAIAYSHYSGGNRRVATFLTTHLASHGYVVAALDHSEVVLAELQRREGETAEEREVRVDGWIANRVPDIGFLLDAVLSVEAGGTGPIGIVGHSFGGWTALASADVDERIGPRTEADRRGLCAPLLTEGSSGGVRRRCRIGARRGA